MEGKNGKAECSRVVVITGAGGHRREHALLFAETAPSRRNDLGGEDGRHGRRTVVLHSRWSTRSGDGREAVATATTCRTTKLPAG